MSTSAGTPPEPSDGRPPATQPGRKDLRDSLWGRALILGVLLLFTLVVSRTCASTEDEISSQQAVELAMEQASFVPCPEQRCRQVRHVPQGIPPVDYWGVVLSEEIGADGQPTRTESFLVNASTGEVTEE